MSNTTLVIAGSGGFKRGFQVDLASLNETHMVNPESLLRRDAVFIAGIGFGERDMRGTFTKIFSVVLVSVLSVEPVPAEDMIKPGTCELIVASRSTLSDARSYVRENVSNTKYTKIFKSQNGWYAVSIGALTPYEKDSVMSSWKASGKIPGDSYCSTGDKYVALYDWRTGDRLDGSASRHASSPGTTTSKSGGGLSAGDALGLIILGGIVAGIAGAMDDDMSSSSTSSQSSCGGVLWVNVDYNSFNHSFSGSCNDYTGFGGHGKDGNYYITGKNGSMTGGDRGALMAQYCACR